MPGCGHFGCGGCCRTSCCGSNRSKLGATGATGATGIASAFRIGFYAEKVDAQTGPLMTVKVGYQNVLFNDGDQYVASTSTFQPTSTGTYQLNAQVTVQLNNSTGTSFVNFGGVLKFLVNNTMSLGTVNFATVVQPGATERQSMVTSAFVTLAAGDTVIVQFTNATNAPATAIGGPGSFSAFRAY